jgi:hypothetical protein
LDPLIDRHLPVSAVAGEHEAIERDCRNGADRQIAVVDKDQ